MEHLFSVVLFILFLMLCRLYKVVLNLKRGRKSWQKNVLLKRARGKNDRVSHQSLPCCSLQSTLNSTSSADLHCSKPLTSLVPNCTSIVFTDRGIVIWQSLLFSQLIQTFFQIGAGSPNLVARVLSYTSLRSDVWEREPGNEVAHN